MHTCSWKVLFLSHTHTRPQITHGCSIHAFLNMPAVCFSSCSTERAWLSDACLPDIDFLSVRFPSKQRGMWAACNSVLPQWSHSNRFKRGEEKKQQEIDGRHLWFDSIFPAHFQPLSNAKIYLGTRCRCPVRSPLCSCSYRSAPSTLRPRYSTAWWARPLPQHWEYNSPSQWLAKWTPLLSVSAEN